MADTDPSQEPQEAPQDAAVNNPAPQDAKVGGEGAPVLSQLYDTLGSVQAGLDVRRQEADEDKKQLLEQEKQLLAQRDQAEQADDDETFAAITRQLEELWEAWGVLNEDDDGEPDDGTRPDQHADGEGDRGGQRDSGSAAPQPGQPG